MSDGVNSHSLAPLRASRANVRPYVVVMIATSRERPLTVTACSSIADGSTVPLMPVLAGPTPLRSALKSTRSQSPRTAAGVAGAGLEPAAPVAVVGEWG